MDIRDFLLGHRGPMRGRAGLRPVDDTVKPMLGTLEIDPGWHGTQYRKVAIDLGTVGVDDHPIDLLCQQQCQCGLAAARRPRN